MTRQTKREIRKVVRSKVADFDEQLWPTNVLILLTAGVLSVLIVNYSRFDPRQTGILDNGFVQLGLVALLVGLLVWGMAWLQSRGIRRVQFCVLLSLILHLGLLAYLHRQHLSFLVRWQSRVTAPALVERERITIPEYRAPVPGHSRREPFERPVPSRPTRAPSDDVVPRRREQGPLEIRGSRPVVSQQPEQQLPEALEIARSEQAKQRPEPQHKATLERQELASLPSIDQQVAVPKVPTRSPEPKRPLRAAEAPSRRQLADVAFERRRIAAATEQLELRAARVSPPRQQDLPSPTRRAESVARSVSSPIQFEEAAPSVPDLPKRAARAAARPLESATAQLARNRAQFEVPRTAPTTPVDRPQATELAVAAARRPAPLAESPVAVGGNRSPARRVSRPLELAPQLQVPRTPPVADTSAAANTPLQAAAAQVARQAPAAALAANIRPNASTIPGSGREAVRLPPSVRATSARNETAARVGNPLRTTARAAPRYRPSPVPQSGQLAEAGAAIATPAARTGRGQPSATSLSPAGEAPVSARQITRAAGSLGLGQAPGSAGLPSVATGAEFPRSPTGTAAIGRRAAVRGTGRQGLTGQELSATGSAGTPAYEPSQAPAIAIGTETLVSEAGLAGGGPGAGSRSASSGTGQATMLQPADTGGLPSPGDVGRYATARLPGRATAGQVAGGTYESDATQLVPNAASFGSPARGRLHRSGLPTGVQAAGTSPGRTVAAPGTELLAALGSEASWSNAGRNTATGQGRGAGVSGTSGSGPLQPGELEAAAVSAGMSPTGAGMGTFQPSARGVAIPGQSEVAITSPAPATTRRGFPGTVGGLETGGGLSSRTIPARRLASVPTEGLPVEASMPGGFPGETTTAAQGHSATHGGFDAPGSASSASATAAGLPGKMSPGVSARSLAARPGGLGRLEQGLPSVAVPGGRDRYSVQPPQSPAVHTVPGRSTSPLLLIEEGIAEMPTPFYEQRDPGRRKELAKQFGGSTQTERAVELALAFLAGQQFSDGRWRLDQWNPNRPAGQADDLSRLRADTAATGLALLAFLGAGYTHLDHRYRSVVAGGIGWLVDHQQPDGALFRPETDPDRAGQIYAHGIASIALCEAYGMTRDPRLREPAERAVEFILAAQDPVSGGWRYTKKPEDAQWRRESDTSVSGWQLMALKSAEMAGLEVPANAWQQAAGWLDKAQSHGGARYCYSPLVPDTPGQPSGRVPNLAMTAEGLLMRMYLGWDRSQPALQRGADYLKVNLPELDPRNPELRDAYYWYYATQVMFQMQGDHWRQWRDALWPMLVETQQVKGPLAGSWDPNRPVRDRWAHAGGRLYVTALNVLMLEVAYRHLPLFQTLGNGR